MFYFSNFPKTLYQISDATYKRPAEYVGLTDITKNVRFKKEILDNITVYELFDMPDGYTMEHISEELYGSPYYHWVLMLLNDRFDYVNDLPMTSIALDKFIDRKYNPSYLESEYGLTPMQLIIDLVDENGVSTDIEYEVPIIKLSDGSEEVRRAMSIWKYDSTLKMNIKKFVYTDFSVSTDDFTADNSIEFIDSILTTQEKYLNTKTHKIDFGIIPNVTPIYAYDYEIRKNDSKRRIKILSESILQTVMKNFKDLM